MASFLYRIGRMAFERRKAVLLAWVVLIALVGGLAGAFGKSADAQLTIPGVESVTATETLQERFPQGGAGGAEARIVFEAPDGQSVTDPANQAAIEKTVDDVADGDQVAAAANPFETNAVSPDGSVAYSTVTYTAQFDEITEASRDQLIEAGEGAETAGLTVELGGEATVAEAEQSATEAIGVLVALLVLAVTFGSMLAAGMPLLTALVGVGAGMAGVTALSAVVDLTSTAPTLGLMIGLAVGIDYALFISIRHKEQMANGMSVEDSAATAVATAGSAVVFAGATVMIALAGLAVVGIPFLTSMGLVAAGMVGVAVLVALTLVPALMGFSGDRFNRWPVPGLRKRQADLSTKKSMGTRWAKIVTKRPVAFLVAGVVGLATLAIPVLYLRLGLPDDGNLNESTTQRQAYDTLADGFGPGFNGPLTVVVDAQVTDDPQAAATVAADQIGELADVAAVAPPIFNEAGDTAIISVIPYSGPSDADTKALVGDIRQLGSDIGSDTGADIAVTGNTAIGIDISDKLTDALPIFLIVVVGLSLLLLTIAFRSILVPLKATGGFLLSLA
ncbi:MAG: MMPL family transporter, partial [Aeromicrobium sp.]